MKDKSIGIVTLVAMGSLSALGYKYMMHHPEVKRNMKKTIKSATKKLYQKLDEMD